jgi:hypothetical protein
MTSANNDEDEADEEDEGETIWGTARQRQQTPTKPRHGKLANLFDRRYAPETASQITIKPTRAVAFPVREASEESTSNVATIKISTKVKEERPSSPPFRPAHVARDQTSYSSSSIGTERSRQPSVLSCLSTLSDDEDEDDDCSLSSMQQQETPKKKLMHIRDGSAFELTGPNDLKEWIPSKAKPRSSGTTIGDLTELVAGPPPLRPCSIVIDLSGEVDEQKQQSSQYFHSAIHRRVARALYPFTGEASFNELSLIPGQSFEIIREDVGGGWSLAVAREGVSEKRGLIPRGWYTYVQDFARMPAPAPQKENRGVKSVDELPALSLNQRIQDTAATSVSSSSFLDPLSPYKTSHRQSGSSSVLSPKDAWIQQKMWDRTRPASGVGQVYSEAGAAIQALTNMQRGNSTPSYISSKSNTSLLRSAMKESGLEEADLSKSSCESEGLAESTSATSIAEEMESNYSSPKPSTSLFTSPWKTPVLFGGRSLNRYVPFVTSGAEEYVLFGQTNDRAEEEDDSNDRFNVVSGHQGYPSWKHPGLVVVAEVHSPEVHTNEQGKEYIAYVVYSSYTLPSKEELDPASSALQDPHVRPPVAAQTSSVYRRFNQFRWLATYLGKLFPILMISMPPFPGTSYGARFDPIFVQRRRRQLQNWLSQVVRHPVLSNEAAVRFFLDSEEEGREWRLSSQKLQEREADLRDAPAMLFSKTFHPLFNVDVCESEVDAGQMAAFCGAYQKGMQTPDTGMLATFKAVRQTTSSTSDSYRQLSYSLLRLITGSPHLAARSSVNGVGPVLQLDNQIALPPMGNVGRRDDSGATNEERAWCWREGCKECKRLTRSLQGTAEALQRVADSYENHSNGGLFELHDRLAMMAKLNSQHASLTEVHKATLIKYRQATGEEEDADDDSRSKISRMPVLMDAAMEQMATRCESVVNVTLSEMDRIHTERCQDWNSLHSHFLDMQIEFYEDVLATLRSARSQCTTDHQQHRQEEAIITSNGPILPSPYESHLAAPHRASPLLQPDAASSSSSYFSIWK